LFLHSLHRRGFLITWFGNPMDGSTPRSILRAGAVVDLDRVHGLRLG
jgi:hypothetical protein